MFKSTSKSGDGPALELRGLLLVILVASLFVGIMLASVIPLSAILWIVSIVASLIGCVLFWRKQYGRFVFALLFFLFLGAWRYTVATPRENPHSIAHLVGAHQILIHGLVSTEPTTTGRSRNILVETNEVSSDNGNTWHAVVGDIRVTVKGSAIVDPYGANYGDNVELRGNLQPPTYTPPDILGIMSFPRIRIVGHEGNPLIEALFNLRVQLAQNIARALPQPDAALLIAIFLSLRTPSITPLLPAFDTTGTAHLIAASGFKITLLAGLLSRGLSRLYDNPNTKDKLLPAQKRRDWRRWLVTLLVLACIGSYTVLSGASPAAIRAGIMGALIHLTPRLGRRYNVYTALACAALLMSMHDPLVLWDVGFQLSFVGTLGILLLTPSLQQRLRLLHCLPTGSYIAEMLAVTLAAQCTTLPIVATTFNNISLIAPLANLLTVPLLGTLIGLGLLVSIVGQLHLQLLQLCAWIAWPVTHYVVTCIDWCYHIPWAYIDVDNVNMLLVGGYYALLILIFITLRVRQQPRDITKQSPIGTLSTIASKQHQGHAKLPQSLRWGVIFMILASWGFTFIQAQGQTNTLQVIFLDLGTEAHPEQGTAILIRTSDGHTSLIDGGLDGVTLTQALDKRLPLWQRDLDTVLLTTPRQDHITGLQDIVERYTIGRVIDAGMLHPSATYARWRRTISEHGISYTVARQGNSISLGAETQLQVLWPISLHKSSDEARENCLILRLVTPGQKFLLLGVASTSTYALQGLLNNIDPSYLQADVIQLVGDASKPFPQILHTVFERVHPSSLVITPSSLRTGTQEATHDNVVPGSSSNLQQWRITEIGTLNMSWTNQGWLTYEEGN